jgi:hypothetical protein
MPVEIAIEAVETFGKHVLPEFDTDPVHATTRQREAWVASQPHASAEADLKPLIV